jgi:hypothetical protein
MAASLAGTLGLPLRRRTPGGGHVRTSLSQDLRHSTPEKGPAMNTNASTTHRLRGLPGPVAASAAFAANAWAAVPPSRGSPPGRHLAGSGPAAPPAAGGDTAAAAAGEGRPS